MVIIKKVNNSLPMSKVLFVSHTANFQKFNHPLMDAFRGKGWRVDYVSSGEEDIKGCDREYKLPIARSPLYPRNILSVFALRKILRNNRYDLIHCHTPTGGVVARLANLLAGRGYRAKIIYTAHGFHFYKGASLSRWLLLYPIEKVLSYVTDAIITINKEDYSLASRKFASKTYIIDGVGVDLARFKPVPAQEKARLRQEYGYSSNDFIVIYVAELIKRKNHEMITRNIDALIGEIPNLKTIFVGNPTDKRVAKIVAQYPAIDSLGYRCDVDRLFQIADLSLSTSTQEGLAINIVEAMGSGLPVVCSNVRGNRDVIKEGINGHLFDLADDEGMIGGVLYLYKNPRARRRIAKNNLAKVGQYSKEIAVNKTFEIYQEVLGER